MAKWMLRQTTTNVEELARQSGVSPVLARILAVRGYQTPAEIAAFTTREDTPLADPFAFADMDKAVSVTINALKNGQRIVIYGDYDADGITSTVILYKSIQNLGGEIEYYIPSREEGYGLNKEAIAMLRDDGFDLIIACDNGISAFDEVNYAMSIGMDIIILDHHGLIKEDEGSQAGERLPAALAVVDAKRSDCPYPYKQYCAAALCYRFSEALYQRLNQPWNSLNEYFLPLVTIATICDLVDLTGENRLLVQKGLPLIKNSPISGLQALLQATDLQDKELDVFHIGFVLGPCINASGRLETADISVELLLTEDDDTAANIAQELVGMNKQRRQLTEDGANLASEIIAEDHLDQDKIVVIYSPDFFESVSGIIAGRIKEKYHKPVIVLAGKTDIVHGSCRSIDCYNIFEGLSSCRDLLVVFGGHPMAAGLTIERAKVDVFRQKINALCELSDDDIQQVFRIDCPLQPTFASLQLARELNLLAPYGKSNPAPLLAAKNLSIEKIVLFGKEEQVMRLLMKDTAGHLAEFVDFSAKDKLKAYIEDNYPARYWQELLAGQRRDTVKIDIIYSLHVNIYNGKETPRLQVVDFRATK